MAVSQDDIDRDCELGRRAHVRLLTRLGSLIEAGDFDVDAPSALPGWTQGMLVTHIARNADGHRRMFEGAALGEVWEQYDGGVDGRTAEIEAGRGVPAEIVLPDVVEAVARLEAAWASTDWIGTGKRTLSKETPIAELPLLRVREVKVHHIDLDIGSGFSDLEPLYVDLELHRMMRSWMTRQPDGTVSLPDAALAMSPANRLAWLTGRLDVDGLDPAGVF